MIVEQIFCHNHLRNFNYIIACEETKQAVVIDPLRVDLILELAKAKQYQVTAIINTHEHHDHTEGNLELVKYTQAVVYCHHLALDRIPGACKGLKKGDVLNIGKTINLEVLDTPGHTMAHVCLLASDSSKPEDNNQLAIFSGDTLFNAGVGRCFSGSVDELYTTFTEIIAKLPNHTIVYPGHDYLQNNINFTLSVEPDNDFAQKLMGEFLAMNDNDKNFIVTDMGIEKKINAFLRLDQQSIIKNIQVNKDKNKLTEKDVFVALRALRDGW